MATRLKHESASLVGVQNSKRLSFEEHLPPRWLGNLTAQLAMRRCSLVSLEASRGAGGLWSVEIVVAGDAVVDVAQLVPFAQTPCYFDANEQIDIATYQLTPDDNGLRLDLIGYDRIGFLASLSATLAGMVLFPNMVQVRTQGERALDSFVLTSLGDQAPHASTIVTLERYLQSRLRRLSTRPPSARG